MVPAVILWSVLAFATVGLALYRRFVAAREDDMIHISAGEEKLVDQQVAVSTALDRVDHWGKILTIVTAVSGLILAGFYIYGVWVDSVKIN